jgi:peptidoglycan hydrolase CwlO-like protein
MDYLGSLAERGVLGVLLAIAFTAVFFLFKMLLAEKDKRIEDATKVRDDLAEPIKSIKENIEKIQEKIIISKERSQ